MFNPDKDDYPSNAAGEPEFASIILTVDGISNNPELGDDVVQKIVLSTQDPITALVAILAYFGEPGLLATPTNAKLLTQAGRCSDPVFVYTPPREGTIQIITSTATWDGLVQHPNFGRGSALVSSDKLQEVVAKAQSDLKQFAGGFSPLILLDLNNVDEDDVSQASGNSEEGAGGAAPIAEGFVRSAAVEDVAPGRKAPEDQPVD